MTYLEFILLIAAICLIVGAAEYAAVYGIYKLAKRILAKAKDRKDGKA